MTLMLGRVSLQDYMNRKLSEGIIADVNHHCFMKDNMQTNLIILSGVEVTLLSNSSYNLWHS